MNKIALDGLPTPVIQYISHLEARVENLTELLTHAQKARFGSSSEQAKYVLEEGYEQESLFNEAEVLATEDEPNPIVIESHTRKPKRTKEELAKELPVKKVFIDIPEDQRTCDICENDNLKAIGQELVRRELSIVPAQLYVTETYRINYGCDDCLEESDEANIIKPEVPVPVVKRGLASPSIVAHVMHQKYTNGMPLYRQEKEFERLGAKILRSTLANWIIYVSMFWLFPLWEALKDVLLESPVIMADETVIQVLKEPGKTPQSESRMWVYCTGNVARPPPIVLFEYQPSRAGEHPVAFLKDIQKPFYLSTDGYAGYNGVKNAVHSGCLAHARRKFEEAMPKKAPRDNCARIGFEYCQKLFALERKFKDLSPEKRCAERNEHSKPILEEFFKWVETVNPLSGSKLAKAITYAINQKKPLSAFLLDGRIDISTNLVENKIRPFAVGRRAWLFADTVNGAKASAVAYSIISTAAANGLNPYIYLKHLFEELPTVLTKDPKADLSAYFPWADDVQKMCRRKNV
ncbi:MAG: IS66 family transposase [Fibromonadaceae bacterium]|jgi:transposase|nr:IS66 family transposase [Fibromonadaceae bacterium]